MSDQWSRETIRRIADDEELASRVYVDGHRRMVDTVTDRQRTLDEARPAPEQSNGHTAPARQPGGRR